MALLTPQVVAFSNGLQPTYSAVNSSDTFVPSDRLLLYVKNTNAATRDVTIVTTQTGVGGLPVNDMTGTVAATTGERIFGPFPYSRFADPATGLATVNYTATANVTAALVELPLPPGA